MVFRFRFSSRTRLAMPPSKKYVRSMSPLRAEWCQWLMKAISRPLLR